MKVGYVLLQELSAATAMLLLLLLQFFSPAAAGAECAFPAVFNFGDSNSDTGGFWAAFPKQRPPFGMTYFKKPSGRASDGRLIVDFLAQALGLPFLSPYLQSVGSNFRHGANFATLASTVLLPNTSLFVTGISPFALTIQLNQMKELRERAAAIRSKGNLPPENIFSKSLYTIDVGQNDFTSNLAAIGVGGVQQYLPQVASQIADTVKVFARRLIVSTLRILCSYISRPKELYAIGGRTFLVFGLRPIGCYPAFLVQLPHSSSDLDMYGCMISYNNAVVDYNNVLKEILARTKGQLQEASVIYVDIHSVMLDLFRHPKDHGLAYGTRACCGYGGGAYNFDPQVYCGNSKMIGGGGNNVTAVACDDPENYVSWDGIHATEAANKLVTLAILSGSYFDPPFPLSKLCNLIPIT